MNVTSKNKTMRYKMKNRLLYISILLFFIAAFLIIAKYTHTETEFTSLKDGDSVRGLSKQMGVEDKEDAPYQEDVERLLKAARRISEKHEVLLVSFINDAFLPFAYSWLCNTEHMNIHDQLIVIAADKDTEDEFRRKRPDIEVVSTQGYTVRGHQSYKTVGYVRMGIKRTQMVLRLLQENVGVFIIEFDCLWLKNPIPPMTQYTDYDLTITQVIGNPPGNVAIGFYYMRASERMKRFWSELNRRLQILDRRIKNEPYDKEVHHNDNDQSFLHVLLREKFAGIKMKIVSQYEFPDGKWYTFSEEERGKYNPYIINNNWIIGVQPKIDRAKEWGHWFANSNATCDYELVKKVVST